jgi:hypothetical protein
VCRQNRPVRERLPVSVGQLVVVAGVALFFVALRLDGWYWRDFGVPGGTGLYFLDLRFFTSAWECIRAGRDVVPLNPCDPMTRAHIYPSIWNAPAPLGLRQEHTVRLGYLLVGGFYVSALAAIGRASMLDGLVWLAALCSPAVLLGVERGNPDLLIFSLVVWGVLLLQVTHSAPRVAAHGLLFLAAALKLYPVLAWGPLLRLPRRWAIVGVGTMTALFGVYLIAIRDDLERIREYLIRIDDFAYGAAILGDEAGGALVVIAAGVALAALVAASALRNGALRRVEAGRDLDLFLAGAAVFVGTFALDYNFNQRMVFLLLTLPQLLRWAREPGAPLPLAAVGVAAVVATLWLGTSLPVIPLGFGEWWGRVSTEFPYDELLNLALFAYLGAGLLLVVAGRWGAALRASTIARG